jgi:antitoxin MazE
VLWYPHCRHGEEANVRTKVQRWGNSLAVRIPKSFAEEVGVTEGSQVEMSLVDGRLVVERAPVAAPTLAELLEGVTEANRHGEADSGPPVGGEAW